MKFFHWIRAWWLTLTRKHIVMVPPDDMIVLCPECGGTVEAIILCLHDHCAYTKPCDHAHDIEGVNIMVGES